MPTALKHFLAIIAVLIVAGCSGGGCGGGGCSSCGGITPLPNGFDVNHRIENAGSVRLTQSGLGFLQSNVGTLAKGLLGAGTTSGGVLQFQVPSTQGSTTGIDYNVCPNGANPNGNPPVCTAEINLGQANLTITPTGPYDLKITGTLPLRLQDLQMHVKGLCVFGLCAINTDITGALNGNGTCPGGTYDDFPLNVDIAIHVDQNPNHTARFGYSQIKINQVVDQTAATDNIKNNIHFCGGILGSILDAVKGLVAGQLITPLIGTLTSQIDNQLCSKATATTPCPGGSTADGSGICRYPDNTCPSMVLGTDGHIDLGGLLASISPGTTGGLDFLFAAGGPDKNDTDPTGKLAWGDLDPVNNGATLGMFGGAEPSPISKCVKLSDIPLPTGIPIPNEIFANTVPNWPAGVEGPHLGIALSERFANYAMNGVYNSGLLCIGISTENMGLLSSSTLGLLIPSSKQLGLQSEAQQVAIVIHPSAPPSVAFGNGTDLATDPLIRVGLKGLGLDFYFFSLDRFIRFLTVSLDVDVPVNLTVGPDGLTPVIENIGVTNAIASNTQLLSEKPEDLAAAISGLIGSIVGQQLGGALKPINLNSSLASLGLELVIPDTVDGQGSPGLRKLTKASDNYLGIFAGLRLATAGGPIQPGDPLADEQQIQGASDTGLEVTKKSVDPLGLKLTTAKKDNAPIVELMATSTLDNGTHAMEYQYKVDKGLWHPFTRNRFLKIQDEWLRVQGRHVISVRSRVAGQPDTLDMTPAEVEVTIDGEAPSLKIKPSNDGFVTVVAKDMITEDPEVRVRLGDGAWSKWTHASKLGKIDASKFEDIDVEARDEEGNIGTAHQDLIRGRAVAAASGCGCTAAGSDQTPGHALWLVGAALAGIGARLFGRRRAEPKPARAPRVARTALRNVIGAVGAMTIASTWAGCSCGSTDTSNHGGTTTGGHTTTGTGGSGPSCPTCVTLSPGLIGEYTSVAVSGNDIWVAGYSEADWDNSNQYGDLVVGKWDGKKVAWNQVDGVPTDPPVDPTQYDTNGFRGGQTEPGEDVGLWTSIAIGPDNNPAVAYYDRTNRALKFAQFDGKTWSNHTVEGKPGTDIGRYAKLLVVGGNFVVAYQSVEAGGDNGMLISKVRIATSAGGKPAAGAWTYEDAVVSTKTPCRAQFCASTEACLSTTKACTATLDMTACATPCGTGSACVDDGSGAGTGTCVTTFDSTKLDAYPDTVADYISIAPDGQGGFGVAYYDRTNGNLGIASKASGSWVTLTVDGQDAAGNDTGDVGIGNHLAIDGNGDWHLVYVNGLSEAVEYVMVSKGTTVGVPEIIDDGLGLAGVPFNDGQHLVGDDGHIVVGSGGEIHVTFQDATAGTLHYAVGTAAATGHTWDVKAVTQEGFAGAFSNIVSANGQLQLVNWWRKGGASVVGDVRIMTPP